MKAERFVNGQGLTIGYFIYCPGCKGMHAIHVEGPVVWAFNGDIEKPTFSPSLLLRSGHHIHNHTGECWCTYEKRFNKKSPFNCVVCHSFITDGKIQFLSDCTHELAGQTVDLPDTGADFD